MPRFSLATLFLSTCVSCRWAQHLAGLDFLPPVPPSVSACRGQSGTEESMLASVAAYRKQARHSSVLAMLRARKEGAAGLK